MPQSASSMSHTTSAPRVEAGVIDIAAEEDAIAAADNRRLELSTSQEREQASINAKLFNRIRIKLNEKYVSKGDNSSDSHNFDSLKEMLKALVNNRVAILTMAEVVDQIDGLKGELFTQLHIAIPKTVKEMQLYKILKPTVTEYFVQIWKVFRLVWTHNFFRDNEKDATLVLQLDSYVTMMTAVYDTCAIAVHAELEVNRNGETMKMPAAERNRGYLQAGAKLPVCDTHRNCPSCTEPYMHEPPENAEIRARNEEETRKWSEDIAKLDKYKKEVAERGNKRKKGPAIPVPLDRFGNEMKTKVPLPVHEPVLLVCKVSTLVDHAHWGWECPNKCGIRTCTLCKNMCQFVCTDL